MPSDFEKVLERLKQVLNVESDKDVANAIGMNPSAFNNRKRSGSIPYSHFIDLSKKQNVDLNWILTGKGTNSAVDPVDFSPAEPSEIPPGSKITKDENGIKIPQWKNPNPDMYHYVPMAEATLNAGGGSFVLSENTTGRYYAFRKNFLAAMASSLKNLILMKVTGNSMEPKIEDGDTVMIDIGRRQLQNGAIYALGYDDIIVIKEVEKLPDGKVLIISKNRKMYPPYEADINSVRIIGQVIWGDRVFVK
ncbi:MAG: helix-turn-helix domain-containing protein [Proteobacteria bacterium]|nr:helix-turn-helix transcriptional regulator [Desulfobacula sp.]MBU3952069.1 helix-turn-helix domain-containing protein [Pseudomonadota bacterium]MBU4132731.1 helix-turn-helix domain-containing protein [Pseudomonadota bacterium]